MQGSISRKEVQVVDENVGGEEKYASGEALEITRAYGSKFRKRLKRIFSRITALPGVPTLMWKNMDKIAAKMSSGYDCKNFEVGDDLSLFHNSSINH